MIWGVQVLNICFIYSELEVSGPAFATYILMLPVEIFLYLEVE